MTTPHDLPPATDPDADRPHKPADDREEVYFQGSPLLRGEIGRVTFFWILALLFMVAPFLLGHRMTLPWWAYLAGVAVGLLIGIVPLLKTRAIRYRISNYRIDFDRGILSRNVD